MTPTIDIRTLGAGILLELAAGLRGVLHGCFRSFPRTAFVLSHKNGFKYPPERDNGSDNMEALCKTLTHDMHTETHGWVKDLEGYDPEAMIYEMAQIHPGHAFAWEPRADREGFVGRFKWDEDRGGLIMCRECTHLYEEWWTDMVEEQCAKHSLVEWLDWRLSLDDVINTDALRLDKDRLGDLEPEVVLRALAEKNPHECYAWESMEHPLDAGTIFIGRNTGEEVHCFTCEYPHWTNWVRKTCTSHCWHSDAQCFPQGGCGCSCRVCEIPEEEE